MIKLNKINEIRFHMGLEEGAEYKYTADYMGLRIHPLDEEFSSTANVTIELPSVNPMKGDTVVFAVNPLLLAHGTATLPSFIGHHGSPVKPLLIFKPFSKGKVELDWVVEYRLM